MWAFMFRLRAGAGERAAAGKQAKIWLVSSKNTAQSILQGALMTNDRCSRKAICSLVWCEFTKLYFNKIFPRSVKCSTECRLFYLSRRRKVSLSSARHDKRRDTGCRP